MILQRILEPEEVLEHIAYSIAAREVGGDSDADITCTQNEDGSVEVTINISGLDEKDLN